MYKAIVIDDEISVCEAVRAILEGEGIEVFTTTNSINAIEQIKSNNYDLIISDLKMPEMDGLELYDNIKETSPESIFIIITAYGTIQSAVDAIKKGIYDYIPKPFTPDEVRIPVRRALERKMLKKENIALKAYIGMDKKVPVIAKSQSMKKVLSLIEGMKDSNCGILLTGESGAGKNLIAHIIHSTSKRKDMPFLAINCATLTEELLASELFGHEKGAFTGAIRTKPGLIEIADTGTLFLDEIAEMTPNLQAKLLKVVEDGEFYRVGGTKLIKVDVRFIAATNQDIKKLIAEGKFREDLYYRLNIMDIFIPPLRERQEDIKPLSAFFLQKHLPESNKKITGFAKETMDILMRYSFPGNVRELENIIERAIILENSLTITPESLPEGIRILNIETFEPGRIKSIDEFTKEYVEKVLKMLGGNRSKTAEMLGISRTSLWKILKEA
ncbi:MAG: sigma-54 dependent transcriptional regulator [Thermodesulfovibrionales bacterium]|nr:sigma-54 dependent transcriptional regulator [Thermodesulfovibrionales bacterium]